jgi:hypothetical protein
MSYTPEQLTTLRHVVQDMDAMRDRCGGGGEGGRVCRPQHRRGDVVRQQGSRRWQQACVVSHPARPHVDYTPDSM